MELTKDEYNILIEATDCWVSKDFGEGLVGSLMTGMMSKDASPEIVQKMKEKDKEERLERESKKQVRKERAIILKAKLLKLRDKIEAKDFCESSQP